MEKLFNFTHAVGVAAIEGLLELSVAQLAGQRHPGRAAAGPVASAHGPVRRHGRQRGVVCMGQSRLRVERPRLRTIPDAAGQSVEVEPPAYTALKNDPELAARMMGVALGADVSTRKYKKTLGQTADAVGVSKSQDGTKMVLGVREGSFFTPMAPRTWLSPTTKPSICTARISGPGITRA